MRSTAMVSRPETSSRVPAAAAQLKANVRLISGLPFALVTCRPGQLNLWVRSFSQPLNGEMFDRPRITTMIA